MTRRSRGSGDQARSRQERVLYPGLLEYEEAEERRAHGIPLHAEVMQWFGHITQELGLPDLVTLEQSADTRG